MSTTAVRSPAEFEHQLQRYLYERSEEGRAVRVGEKEVSEQAAIVARYADLFSRDQLRALRDDEERAEGDQREWLYRLRKTCEGGLVAAELAERDDELENAILAARIEFQGEKLPLRSAQANLAVLDGYSDRDELGRLYREASAEFNAERLELIRAYEELDLDDRPQKAPRACVIASDPPKIVHLITRAIGGLHDYQAFLHEAGHALHYANVDASLPYTFRRLSRDHALTEIYSYICEAITREPGWHAEYFGLSDEEARENAEATLFLEAILFRRYAAKLRFELDFWSDFEHAGLESDEYAQQLTTATGMAYTRDGHLADMDAGFYSADYLRAWIRHAQLRAHLISELGDDWWRNPQTGEILRKLFTEGTRPTSEQIAARLGYEPFDIAPLVAELNE